VSGGPAAPARILDHDLLRRVGRSFALSLAVLPGGVREPVGLAYLLARAADTVADTRLLPRHARVAHLETLRAAIAGARRDLSALGEAVAPLQGHEAERRLLAALAPAVASLEALPAADAVAVRGVLATLTSGMILDLERFPGEDEGALAALDTLEELDRYTYLVAGCVGPFWTAVHAAHRPRLRGWDHAGRREQAVRFGQGLQLINVLRDVHADLRSGRCYLPARELADLGLRPPDLLDPGRSPDAWPLVRRLLARALEHCDVGWRYTLDIPRGEWRMRLACAWPLLIGLETLAALAAHPDPIAARTPVKIARPAVRRILARSAVAVCANWSLAAVAGRARARAASALGAPRR
jgi:farnesyl-diphosphate farnesyltransferase